MRRLREYRDHATECREMAAKLSPKYREPLLEMARMWETLALEREAALAAGKDPDHVKEFTERSGG